MIGQNDARLKKNQSKAEEEAQKQAKGADVVREVYATFCPSSSFELELT